MIGNRLKDVVLGHSTSEAKAGPVFSKHYQFAAETVFCCQEISNSVQLWINFTGNCSLVLTATGCFNKNAPLAYCYSELLGHFKLCFVVKRLVKLCSCG